MARDDTRTPPDPERRRPAHAARREAQHGEAWGAKRGRSGYGIESIRPHLRAQLEQRKLWRQEFPPEAPKDEHGDDDDS